jgi:hypothetical protein
VSLWKASWRADPRARLLADRHYSRQSVGADQFVPPGRCLVLYAEGPAYWVTSWPLAQYVRHRWPGAWQCSAFRREGGERASDLIRSAVAATRWRFGEAPELGMVTFIDVAKVRHKRDPGRCFLRAGFEPAGYTLDRGLLALRLGPEAMPDPEPPVGAQLRLEMAEL